MEIVKQVETQTEEEMVRGNKNQKQSRQIIHKRSSEQTALQSGIIFELSETVTLLITP